MPSGGSYAPSASKPVWLTESAHAQVRLIPAMPSARFPSAIGECSVSWSDAGLTGFAFPATPRFPARHVASDRHDPSTAFRPPATGDCPPVVAAVIARIQRHLAGEPQDFADLAYDWSIVTDFQRRVLRALLTIGPGRIATYGDLARMIGAKPGAARAIGGAVGANPWPLLVPCHRILGAGGKLTGYSAPGGTATKVQLLALEGVELGA